MSKAIITFIKNPQLGKVKTRLAKSVGDEKAMEIYLRLTKHTRETISAIADTEYVVYYSDFINNQDDWDGAIFDKKLQCQGGLGERMSEAFFAVLQNHDKVLIVGSDCAQLKPKHIEDAFLALENNNVVVGPTFDGGYYLLGMDSYYPFLFENITWSSSSVYSSTIKKIEKADLTYRVIDQLSDIDYIEDWEKYGLDVK